MKNIQKFAFLAALIGGSAFADAPNPVNGFTYHKGMVLMKKGEENGREVLKTPENQEVCIGKIPGQNYMRFGYVDGTNCMTTWGGAQSINLNSDQAFLVHVPEKGEWISANDMQNNGGEFYMLPSGPDKASSPAFIPGKPAGTFYAPFSHNGYWFANKEGNDFKERNDGDKNKIKVFMPNAVPNPIFGVPFNPGMKLVRFGKEGSNKILLTSDKKTQVCAGIYKPQKAFRFGRVEGTNCLVAAWGANNINLNGSDAYLVSYPGDGDWIDLPKAKANTGGKLSTSAAGIQDNLYPIDIPGKGIGIYSIRDDRSWYVSAQNGQYKEVDAVNEGTQNTGKVFIPKSAAAPAAAAPAPAATGPVPNPIFDMSYEGSTITLIRLGQENGKKLLLDPSDNKVCIARFRPADFGNQGQDRLNFGYVDDKDNCRIGSWGGRSISLRSDKAFLVHVPKDGKWVDLASAGNLTDLALSQKAKNDGTTQVIGYSKVAKTTMTVNPGAKAGWFAEKGSEKELSENNAANIQVYVPNKDAPAAPAPAATGPVANPLFNIAYKDVEFLRPGQENGKAIVTVPGTENKSCMMVNKQGSTKGLPGDSQMMFGQAKQENGKWMCYAPGWEGWKGYSFEQYSDAIFLVHAPKGGMWKKATELQDPDYAKINIALKKDPENPYNTGIAALNGIPAKYHTDGAVRGWYGDKGKVTNNDQMIVFLPGEAPGAAPAPTPAAPLEDPTKVFKLSEFVTLIKAGEETGKDFIKTKGPKGEDIPVCAFDFNPAIFKAGERQFVFGNVRDGKCNFEAWGLRQPLMRDGGYYLSFAKGGNWKKRSEINDEELKRSLIVEGNNNTKFPMGVGSYQGFAGKRFEDKVWFVDANFKDIHAKPIADADALVYIPNKDVPATPAPVATPAPTPVAAAPTPAPVPTPAPTPVVATPAPVEAPKPAEVTPVVATPAPAPTPVVATPAPASVVDTPRPEVTPTPMNTSADMINLIQQGKVVVDDPDLIKKLESQPTVMLDGEPIRWMDYGAGWALSQIPVSRNESSGVICRIIINDKAYVGNVYKNNRAVLKDTTVGDMKVGDFICRAGTDLDGNKVYASTTFQTLGSRGDTPLWGPIVGSLVSMWETGYKNVIAGTQATENGKQITVPGICRARKEESDPNKFHVGRAVMDSNNKPHCYIKAKGVETDLVGDYLATVEVLFRPTLEGATGPAAPAAGAPVAPASVAAQ